jgi:hypothetical protein
LSQILLPLWGVLRLTYVRNGGQVSEPANLASVAYNYLYHPIMRRTYGFLYTDYKTRHVMAATPRILVTFIVSSCLLIFFAAADAPAFICSTKLSGMHHQRLSTRSTRLWMGQAGTGHPSLILSTRFLFPVMSSHYRWEVVPTLRKLLVAMIINGAGQTLSSLGPALVSSP